MAYFQRAFSARMELLKRQTICQDHERAVQLIGACQDLERYAQSPEKALNEATLVRAGKLFTSRLDLQWVGGDARTAENSFFRINVSATILDDTRALIHAGRGHKFWSEFPATAQRKTEQLPHDINEVSSRPILEDPIKTVELPVAGHSYSPHSFQMLLHLVDMVNDITAAMWMPQKPPGEARSAPYSRDSIDAPVPCVICKTRLHSRSISADHETKLSQRGFPVPRLSLREESITRASSIGWERKRSGKQSMLTDDACSDRRARSFCASAAS
jgi:hypothetical protein